MAVLVTVLMVMEEMEEHRLQGEMVALHGLILAISEKMEKLE